MPRLRMRLRSSRLALTSLLAALCTAAGCVPRTPTAAYAHESPRRTVVRAARLVDPATVTSVAPVVVIVEGRRVREVLRASEYRARPGDLLVEVGGATLLPGLIDAHVHLTIGGAPAANAAADVRAGFTTVADLGARSDAVVRLRDSVAAGLVPGPRILAAGLWVGVRGGVCEFGGIGVPRDSGAIAARVRQNLSMGADLIKLCVTGWPALGWSDPDSVELRAPWLAGPVAQAHGAGRIAVAHAIGRQGVAEALAAGVDGLAHAAFLDSALIARMRRQGMWMIPTLASLTAGDTTPASRALAAAVRAAHAGGVRLVFGTDGGVLPHGRNAEEALALARVGLSPAEILRAATSDAAAALGIADSVGAVRPGMLADLVAVDGDPLTDAAALTRPRFVMAAGRVVRQAP